MEPDEEQSGLTVDEILETLRRLPDRIVLAVMGRDLDLADGERCLCGWALREKIAELKNVGASTVRTTDAPDGGWHVPIACANQFGGDELEWEAVFVGATNHEELPVIEAAWVQRVDEAVYGRRRVS